MIWNICFIISLSVLLLSIFISTRLMLRTTRLVRHTRPFDVLIAGVGVSVFTITLPVFIEVERLGIFKSIFMSLHTVIRFFIVDIDYTFIGDAVNVARIGWLDTYYTSLATVLHVFAPILTFGFIMSFFKNFFAYFKYIFLYFRQSYIFSELNEKSLALATDIKNNEKNANIIFTSINEKYEEDNGDLVEEAKKLGAIIFKKEITTIGFGLRLKHNNTYFFTINEQEEKNASYGVKLCQKYGNRKNVFLFVFSTRPESELVFTRVSGREMMVHRVNEVRTLVYNTLFEMGSEIYERAKGNEDENGDTLISALVVGLGKHGSEMVKALSWFCQLEGHRVEITAIDKNESVKDHFTALAPGLYPPADSNTPEIKQTRDNIDKLCSVSIKIDTDSDVDGDSFLEKIRRMKNKPSYIFVCLGNDKDNIRVAMNIRSLCIRLGINPIIQAVVYNSDTSESLVELVNHRGQLYDIDFIGKIESRYSRERIIAPTIENMGLEKHLRFDPNGRKSFYQYEYNYYSSIACAIHYELRRKLGRTRKDGIEGRDRIEHARWNAYMLSEGYLWSGSLDRDSRNDLAKLHNLIVPFDMLSADDRLKDEIAE